MCCAWVETGTLPLFFNYVILGSSWRRKEGRKEADGKKKIYYFSLCFHINITGPSADTGTYCSCQDVAYLIISFTSFNVSLVITETPAWSIGQFHLRGGKSTWRGFRLYESDD